MRGRRSWGDSGEALGGGGGDRCFPQRKAQKTAELEWGEMIQTRSRAVLTSPTRLLWALWQVVTAARKQMGNGWWRCFCLVSNHSVVVQTEYT